MSEPGGRLDEFQRLLTQPMLRIVQEISPLDGMYQGNLLHYFNVGQSAMRWIRLALLAAGAPDVKRILDLPCGFGRVLRVLRAEFPGAEIVACDREREGVDFCAEMFGATPIYSLTEPDQIPLVGEFDLIWCGSLLTHLDADRWILFLKRFESSLAACGVVVFTTHGRCVADRMRRGNSGYGLGTEAQAMILRQFHSVGFGFQPYADSSDSDNYGISVSSPVWVCRQIQEQTSCQIVLYSEQAWDWHHDVVACVRSRKV